MNHRISHLKLGDGSADAAPGVRASVKGSGTPGLYTRLSRWWLMLMATLFWLGMVYGLPLHSLREARQVSRVELARLIHAGKPDPAAILDAFDRATERILFSASGPYLILACATIFLVAHLVAVKRRLDAAERHIQTLRDVILGVDGTPLR